MPSAVVRFLFTLPRVFFFAVLRAGAFLREAFRLEVLRRGLLRFVAVLRRFARRGFDFAMAHIL
jgi:hypothetical protein